MILTKECCSVLNHDKRALWLYNGVTCFSLKPSLGLCMCSLNPMKGMFFIKIFIKICPFAAAGAVLIYTC